MRVVCSLSPGVVHQSIATAIEDELYYGPRQKFLHALVGQQAAEGPCMTVGNSAVGGVWASRANAQLSASGSRERIYHNTED